MNLGSFSGFYGHHVKAPAESMPDLGIYDRYGSDLHAPEQAGIFSKGCSYQYVTGAVFLPTCAFFALTSRLGYMYINKII